MKQTRKGNAWHFGMKLHIGTDLRGRVHSLTATHAAVADITPRAPASGRPSHMVMNSPTTSLCTATCAELP